MVHGSSPRDAQRQVEFAEAFLKEFQSTIIIDDILGPRDSRPASKWHSPQACRLKINSDAAINVGSGFVGVGLVFRDHDGRVFAACAKWLYGQFSVDDAKLLAI